MSFNEWREVKLGELIDSISVKHKFDKDKLIFLNTSDILEGEILHNNYSDVKNMPGQAKKSINKGDILFSEIRPKNKRFAYVDFDGEDFVVSTKLMVLRRKNNDIDNKFLYKYLTSEIMLNYLQTMAEGRSGTFPQITFSELKSIDVKLPPIEEQKAIAKILSDLDDKIEVNNKINKRLEDMAQSVFKHWFVDFEFPNEEGKPYKSSGGEMAESELGMIPKGWEVKKIGDIGKIITGKTPSAKDEDGFGEGYNFITPRDISNYTFILETERSLSTIGAKKLNKNKIDKNSIGVSCIGSNLGEVYITGEDSFTNQQINSIRLDDEKIYPYVYIYLKNMKTEFLNMATGSAVPIINKTSFSGIDILIPEQDALYKFVGIITESFKLIKYNLKEIKKLSDLRDILLPKLMSGEIRVPIDK